MNPTSPSPADQAGSAAVAPAIDATTSTTTTVHALVQAMSTRLTQAGVAFGHGTTNARDEAAWLTMWKLGLSLDAYDEVADSPVSPANVAGVEAVIAERIASRKPAAYLTHEAWLQGVPFYVDERCIVPRSFIAELLGDPQYGDMLDAWLSDQTRRVLDLCTGNGSLAVLAAMAYPDVVVDGADLSHDALDVARINVQRHQLGERITLLHSDGLKSVNGPYDLILCNPPYVNAQSMAALPPEFKAEPELALAGGADGMDFIRALLADLPKNLTPHGVLVLEIGHERAHFEAAFPRLPAIWLETSAGSDQVLLLPRDVLAA
ncbi:protein-(glutamine-N5) methyltransferase, ribosomal protein L3-specific [Leptothrix cholodnii SP-6]|uniref:Protein-(Glutamine-N5) methyltransferase, ribosomal protein L3-specific n=1 Tax=Leptothrix cholodnii (strain ATCC 51168 / LMG 8142 / SP-6) TaxID=395495 RepID=B1Y6E8_LEPCP|nr:50S ribosomal protein L3 N(5)-glutamine methyltransferase [Leptothrix cholodnii]ACB34784.1 protein-(glutamine-N5) methyltransferase, ribosomal protein L3-specific [Leptothrix cholodnii SP-6]